MGVPLNMVPTGWPAETSVCSWFGCGLGPGSLYQARPNLLPAWLNTKVAVKPQSGENALGVGLASACQSMASPRPAKKTLSEVSFEGAGCGTWRPLGSMTTASAGEAARKTASAEAKIDVLRMRQL